MSRKTKTIGGRQTMAGISAWTGRAAVLTALLAACNTVAPLGVEATDPRVAGARYDYALSVTVGAQESQAAVEARYGGRVVSWYPELGSATLGLNEAEARAVRPLVGTNGVVALEENGGALEAPEVTRLNAAGEMVAGNVAMGGIGAWGGGIGAWGGGIGAWGGGSYQSAPENATGWGQIRLPQARALAKNLGTNVKVAIIDSGLDLAHPAFSGRLAPAADMWDFVGNDATPQEEGTTTDKGYGHGTSVAGIVAQVAPNAKLLPIRVLGKDGSGDVTAVAAAINRAVLKGAKVINLSLGTVNRSTAIFNAVNSATKAGVFVVASSGNTGDTKITYPAEQAKAVLDAGRGTVSVGSVDARDLKSSFSTYGGDIEIVAPGEKVFGPYPGGQRAYWTGTSMAAPMVSGGLALALGQTLKVPAKELAQYVIDKSTNIYNGEANKVYKDKIGKGRLNLEEFLKNTIVY